MVTGSVMAAEDEQSPVWLDLYVFQICTDLPNGFVPTPDKFGDALIGAIISNLVIPHVYFKSTCNVRPTFPPI